MWLKLIGCCLVIIAGTLTGFSLAARYNERPKQVRQLIGCITSLGSYINYVSLPLSEALIRSAGMIEGPVRDLFQQAGSFIDTSGWRSPQEAFAEALNMLENELAIHKPEREIMLLLGANLGAVDRKEQQKHLDLAKVELEKIHQEAIIARDQNVKMYRYLGVCGGLAIAILLV
ncbi:MAG: spoIIIAB [Firmicutes bacterium]|nr:spoIIIAB [Bacillota bacterium]